MADTEGVIARGTKVQITDRGYDLYPLTGHIEGYNGYRYDVSIDTCETIEMPREDFAVIEPTIGQLVDRMHEVIERVSEAKGSKVITTHIDLWVEAEEYRVTVKFSGCDGVSSVFDRANTPQAALTAMIERLEGMVEPTKPAFEISRDTGEHGVGWTDI